MEHRGSNNSGSLANGTDAVTGAHSPRGGPTTLHEQHFSFLNGGRLVIDLNIERGGPVATQEVVASVDSGSNPSPMNNQSMSGPAGNTSGPGTGSGPVGNDSSHGARCVCGRKRKAPESEGTSMNLNLNVANPDEEEEECQCEVPIVQGNSSGSMSLHDASSSSGQANPGQGIEIRGAALSAEANRNRSGRSRRRGTPQRFTPVTGNSSGESASYQPHSVAARQVVVNVMSSGDEVQINVQDLVGRQANDLQPSSNSSTSQRAPAGGPGFSSSAGPSGFVPGYDGLFSNARGGTFGQTSNGQNIILAQRSVPMPWFPADTNPQQGPAGGPGFSSSAAGPSRFFPGYDGLFSNAQGGTFRQTSNGQNIILAQQYVPMPWLPADTYPQQGPAGGPGFGSGAGPSLFPRGDGGLFSNAQGGTLGQTSNGQNIILAQRYMPMPRLPANTNPQQGISSTGNVSGNSPFTPARLVEPVFYRNFGIPIGNVNQGLGGGQSMQLRSGVNPRRDPRLNVEQNIQQPNGNVLPGVSSVDLERSGPTYPPVTDPYMPGSRLHRAAVRRVLDFLRGRSLYLNGIQVVNGDDEEDEELDDMRLDVDGMSYEDLLALGELMGEVNTGLSEEAILQRLKKRKFRAVKNKAPKKDPETCCICLDEYENRQELGNLDCGHNFHFDCIKQWLMQKNFCPICKRTALPEAEEDA